MYWFNTYLKRSALTYSLALALLMCAAACRPQIKGQQGSKVYFDLKGYFKNDSARLAKLHPLINKTVGHNGATQTKNVYIDNWGSEFELFTSSDINKPAWQQSYDVKKNDSMLVYSAKLPGLKTRQIVIKRSGNRIKSITIFNHTKNVLYENTEKLSYFPDSVYLIEKTQQVKLLGKNTYTIKGVFR